MTQWFEYDIVELTKPTIVDRSCLAISLNELIRQPTEEEIANENNRQKFGVIEPGKYLIWINSESEIFYQFKLRDNDNWDVGLLKNVIKFDNQKTYHVMLPNYESADSTMIDNLIGKVMFRGTVSGIGSNVHLYFTDESDWVHWKLIYD